MTKPLSEVPEPARPSRRVHSRVALTLLEVLRSQDLPVEILDDENVTLTMPRRLGLSDVIDNQIRLYREAARRRRRVPETEVRDLMRLVIRRPDSAELFFEVGRRLTELDGEASWRRIYPNRAALALVRRRVRRRLSVLFGGDLVRTADAPLVLDAEDDTLIEADPGGDACAIVTGLAQAVTEAYGVRDRLVIHVACRGRGADSCRWLLADAPG